MFNAISGVNVQQLLGGFMQEENCEKIDGKKGFWAELVEKIDKKLKAMACSGGCDCSGHNKKGGKCC